MPTGMTEYKEVEPFAGSAAVRGTVLAGFPNDVTNIYWSQPSLWDNAFAAWQKLLSTIDVASGAWGSKELFFYSMTQIAVYRQKGELGSQQDLDGYNLMISQIQSKIGGDVNSIKSFIDYLIDFGKKHQNQSAEVGTPRIVDMEGKTVNADNPIEVDSSTMISEKFKVSESYKAPIRLKPATEYEVYEARTNIKVGSLEAGKTYYVKC